GFFYNEYSLTGSKNSKFKRNYFSESNARKIDSIRLMIEEWYQNNYINEEEYYILISSLIEATTKVSNTSGTYGAFLKFDDYRKNKPLMLEPIEFIKSEYEHSVYCEDIFQIINKIHGDILYLDPPYNNRQYPPYYHILETVTLYDNPAIYGKTGRRPYKDKISPFCIKKSVSYALERLIDEADFDHIFLSYNTDGLLSKLEIKDTLSKYGPVSVFRQSYRRYKSNSNGIPKKNKLKELIFYVKKKS
ncbi:MAG TPA: hypothetical protein GXZ50_05930, partial [Clostridia bacterium]|nr:hypothetical protein [Clostridia bacterium]